MIVVSDATPLIHLSKIDVDPLMKKHSIHIGEASSILLAKELSSLLLINERDGREAAKKEGVTVKGTLGIIADGVKEEKISVKSAIALLKRYENEPKEFWLDPKIVRKAIDLIADL